MLEITCQEQPKGKIRRVEAIVAGRGRQIADSPATALCVEGQIRKERRGSLCFVNTALGLGFKDAFCNGEAGP
jgi:hypothetical protein